MTLREQKAKELVRREDPLLFRDKSDEDALRHWITKLVLEGMEWQAEQCVIASHEIMTGEEVLGGSYVPHSESSALNKIKNAGKKSV